MARFETLFFKFSLHPFSYFFPRNSKIALLDVKLLAFYDANPLFVRVLWFVCQKLNTISTTGMHNCDVNKREVLLMVVAR